MNPKNWTDFYKTKSLIIESSLSVTKDTKFFAMGSCFAMEIYTALKKLNYDCFPKYIEIKINKKQIFDKIPAERDFIAHYDIQSIKQEFESALGLFKNQDREKGYYEVTNMPVNKFLSSSSVFQDPHRKLCYASSMEDLIDLSNKITLIIKDGIEKADVLILTLGLIESWKNNLNNKFFCRPPNTGYGGGDGFGEFHLTNFEENYKDLTSLIHLIQSNFPKKHVVISVSPVPLQLTYRNCDVYTANMESKSLLRSVAGRVCAENSNFVTYFPSYELASLNPYNLVFGEDGRHINKEFAEFVINFFIERFTLKKN